MALEMMERWKDCADRYAKKHGVEEQSADKIALGRGYVHAG